MKLDSKQTKFMRIVIAYPFGILAIAVLINLLFLEVDVFQVSLPLASHMKAFTIAAILLVINHTWLMTMTELTRIRYKMYATPEEWKASGTSWHDIPDFAIRELERTHNAHRNTTENTVCFLVIAVPFVLISPPITTAYIWLIGFSVARLGHTLSYLNGKDNLRGVFMSFSLIAMYGAASYLVLSVLGIGLE